MKQRDKAKNRREIMFALSMVMQIGLSMMVCMSLSLLIGYGIDRLVGTKFWTVVMMFIGILASIRSMLVLTGQFPPGKKKDESGESDRGGMRSAERKMTDGDSED